jgi:hypothetical protein
MDVEGLKIVIAYEDSFPEQGQKMATDLTGLGAQVHLTEIAAPIVGQDLDFESIDADVFIYLTIDGITGSYVAYQVEFMRRVLHHLEKYKSHALLVMLTGFGRNGCGPGYYKGTIIWASYLFDLPKGNPTKFILDLDGILI